MKSVLNFIYEWRFPIMVVLWVITYALTNFIKFKSDLKTAMLAAKQMSKDQILKSGKEQMEWVVNLVYNKLPKGWANILGETKTRNLIQELYNAALDLIDDGKLNNSI